MEEPLPFPHRLLYYLLTAQEEEPKLSVGGNKRLEDFEKAVLKEQQGQQRKVTNANTTLQRTVRTSNGREKTPSLPSLAKIIASGSYRLTLAVKSKATGQIAVINAKLDAEFNPTLIDRELASSRSSSCSINGTGRMRLIAVNFSYEPNTPLDCIHRLASQGFTFLDRRCLFFASKDPETRKAFFILCENTIPTPISSFEESDSWATIASCTHKLRQKFGCFEMLKSLPVAGARAGLLVSGSLEGLRRAEGTINITMLSDIFDSSKQKTCLTEGSGFISKNLADAMPQSVMQGRVGSKDRNIPAAFQVRVFVPSMGIFKGTLVVKEGLGSDCIELRPSMLKVPVKRQEEEEEEKATDSDGLGCDGTEEIVVEIVNTSRAPRYHSSNLNHQLLHALHACGVEFEAFEGMLRQRVALISHMCHSRDHAVQYFRGIERHKSINIRISSNKVDEDNQEKEGLESDRLRGILLSMLLSNHSIHDPYIQSSMRTFRDREIDDLLSLKLPISPAVYLMGIPDPTGLLKANEVYVGRHGDHNISAGDVVCVTRFPLVRSKAIRSFHVVGQHCEAREQLDIFFAERVGMVVFASGGTINDQNVINECPVGSMGGDYDGDLYFVTSQKEIVGSFIKAQKSGKEGVDHCTQVENDADEISIVFDLPLSPGTETPSPPRRQQDTSMVMPVIPSRIQPSTFHSNKDAIKIVDNIGSDGINSFTKLLMSSPATLTPEELSIGFCLEFIYSMSPPMFITTFVDGKLGYSGKNAISNDIPSKEAVGRWSNLWIAAVDKDGIDSRLASTYAELHDIALQYRKHPVFCSYSSILEDRSGLDSIESFHNSPCNNIEYPHYLMKEASKSFESTSTLGKLFNLTRILCDGIPLAFNGCPGVYTDNIRSTGSVLDSFVFSLDPDLRCAQSSDFIILAQKLYDEYLTEKSMCNSSGAGAGGFRVSIVNRSASSSMPKCEIFTGSVASTPTSVRTLSDRYKRLFQELVVSIATRLDRPVLSVQAALASALYEVSYLAATNALDGIKRQRKEMYSSSTSSSLSDYDVENADKSKNDHIKRSGNNNDSSNGSNGSGGKIKDFSIHAECSKIIKAISRSLAVPWSICGYVLNNIKSDAVAKRRLEKDVKCKGMFTCKNSSTLPLVNGLTVDLLVAKSLDELKLQPAFSLSFNAPSDTIQSHSESQNVHPQINNIASSNLSASTSTSTSEKIKRDKDKMHQLLMMEHTSTLGLLNDDGGVENLLLGLGLD